MNGISMKSELSKKVENLKLEKSEFVKNVERSESTDTELYEYTDDAWDYVNDFDDISLDDL